MIGKNDILEKIKAENEGCDPYEAEISKFSWKIAAIFALTVATIIFLVELAIDGKYNFGIYCVMLSAFSVKFLAKAIKTHKMADIIYAVVFSALFLLMLVVYSIAFYNGWL